MGAKAQNRFDLLLRSRRREKPAADDAGGDALAAFYPGVLVREGPRETTKPEPVRPPVRVEPHQRLLLGSGAALGQARIQIRGGRLAGSEIQLCLRGTRIDAQVLTPHEASRQTLVTAMDVVGQRLRQRGLILRAASAATPSARERDGEPSSGEKGRR
jgi:hypothetical protein